MCGWWWCMCVYKDFLCVCKFDTYKNVAILMFLFIYLRKCICTTNVDEANILSENIFFRILSDGVCLCVLWKMKTFLVNILHFLEFSVFL